MTTATKFSRQNDTGSCARTTWNLMVSILFYNRELKNHDDGFVDDDRKWDTVHCASAVNKFRRRGVVDDAKYSTVTSSCSPQASAGITPCF